jgi:hypothetical protein
MDTAPIATTRSRGWPLPRSRGPGGTIAESYGFDDYGNLTTISLNGQPLVTNSVSQATNRLTDATYDAAGNQTAQCSRSATYDGFGMVSSYQFDGVNTVTYIYSASDERIGVLRGDTWTWSLRDPEGKVLRQYQSSESTPSAPWLWVEDFVYANGKLLGSERPAILAECGLA